MIAGFEDVTSGSIALGKRRIEELPPARRRVAMAFEGYSLYPALTVRENIGFALKAQQLSRSDVSRRVHAIARLVEIEDILDSFPRAISGGQQQRVSLARALVRDADLYLLDEPMGQLEPQLRAVLRGRIKGLLAERGMTAIFVTHDQTEASALADRIAVMEDGILQQFAKRAGTEEPSRQSVRRKLHRRAADESAGDRGGTDRWRFRLSVGTDMAFQVPGDTLDAAARKALEQAPRVRVGIRPQKIAVGTGDVHLRVVSNQWLGDQSHVAAECAGNLLIAVTASKDRGTPQDSIAFALEPRHLHIFGPDGICIRHAEVS